jgi:hypothetical protein
MPGYFACNFPMPFFRSARIELRSATKLPAHAELYTWIEHRRPSARSPYFHALYHEQKTVGYFQYPVLQVRGEGFFVGMNLFDSGHNHGGGDTAFIDGGTAHPRLLHGICGEDYFGFAWHHTGAMTPLTGAPAHDRRYRLHLENPYPFHESFQLFFGAFAGLHPKSVAFWYQFPNHSTIKNLRIPDIPWKVLGPLSMEDALQSAPSDQKYQTVIPFKEPLTLSADWQNVDMNSGYLDLTYHFRHYALTEKGSGYVPGKSKYSLVTYVYSQAEQRVRATLGHDDPLLIKLNGQTTADMGSQEGFHAAEVLLPLHAGWNKLNLIVWNDENVNWRWAGISLAFEDRGSPLSFASEE